MKAAILGDRRIIAVTGEEAAGFLHNLVTNSVDALRPGEARYAALLIPQGKIIADFFVLRTEEGFLLDVPAAHVADLVKRLTLYRLRAKIAIEDRAELSVLALFGGDVPSGAFADPRLPALGARAIMPTADVDAFIGFAGATPVPEDEYHRHRIGLGVPEGGRDFAYGEAFPHEADMDQFAGVDFRKGCYIGQEVVSRMQHRGTARTRAVPVAIEGAAEPGSEIRAGERPIGTLGSVAGELGIAMIRLDRADDAIKAGEPLVAGTATLTVLHPDWARFPIPGDPAAQDPAASA